MMIPKRFSSLALLFLLLTMWGYPQAYNESNDFSYALKLYNEGFYEIAVQQFSTFINRYPGSDRQGDARYYYADALQKTGNVDDARIEFQGLAVSLPDHSRAPEAWSRVGECYRELGKLAEAAKAFETVKILYPGSPEAPPALLEAARTFLAIDQLNRAEQTVKEFLDRYLESSEYPAGRILFAEVLLAKDEPERAGAEFRRISELTDSPQYLSQALLGEARVYQRLGLMSRAQERLTQLLADYPNVRAAREASEELCAIYLDRHEFAEALAVTGKALERYSDQQAQTRFKMLRAQVYFEKGDYALAAKELGQLLKSVPNESLKRKLKFYQASSNLKAGENEKAYRQFHELYRESAATDDELIRVTLVNLTRLSIQSERFDEARQFLMELSEKMSPGVISELLHYDLVTGALAAGDLNNGQAEFQRFMALYPNSPLRDDLLYKAAEANFSAKNYRRAAEQFAGLTEQYPSSPFYPRSLEYLKTIRTYYQKNQDTGVQELARLFGRMLTDEDRKSLLFDLGKIYLHDLKDYNEASRVFAAFVEKAPDSARAGEGWYYLSKSVLMQRKQQAQNASTTPEHPETLLATLKRAVPYAAYSPAPDSLTFWFLNESLHQETIPAVKLVQFWDHFLTTYPDSKLKQEVQMRLADACLLTGDSTRALQIWNEVVTVSPRTMLSGDAYWRLADFHSERGNATESERYLKDYLLEIKIHPRQAEAYLRLGRGAAAGGDLKAAAQFYERILKRYDYSPSAAIAREEIIDTYIQSGDLDKALVMIEKIVAQFPPLQDHIAAHFLDKPQPSLYFYAGKAYFQQEEYSRARKNLLTFLNTASDARQVNESLYLLGKMAEEEDDTESALLQYALVKPAESDTFFYQANRNRADILFRSGKYSEASSILNNLIEIAPDAAHKQELEALKIRCLINQEAATKAAIQSFSKSYKKSPALKEHLAAFEYEQGRVAFRKKRFDNAISHFKTIMKKYKNTGFVDDAHFMLGQTYATLNKPEEAVKIFQAFQSQQAGSPLISKVHLSLASIHLREERQDAGLEEARKAAETANDPASKKAAFSLLINVYKQIGLWDGVLNSSREYVQLFPNADDAVNKKISIGNAMVRLNRYQEAIDYFKKLKFEVSSQEEPEIQFYIGEAYYNSGQYQTAINEFMKIPLLSQKTKLQWEASALYFAGQSYEKLGRSQEAIRMYQQIVDRPGIQVEFKRQARQLINKLKNLN